ncbi:head completion/stabilization protein [Plesiomonas shigelloides]|uniref:head completion/stabilization protein n=1 Tax=Plesiomonas shigelloides TaxID=703 RepID=UPI000579C891|nr:head completion/stabilization protein [Plesiomonas shigelloides]
MYQRTSGFIPSNPAPDDDSTIKSGDFWPEISLKDLRSVMRTDGTVTNERLHHATITAISTVNSDLSAWADKQTAAGHTKLTDVPAMQIDGESVLLHNYRRAVYSMARASLYERYLDSSATSEAVKDADAKDQTADDLYRDARFAIRDILGVTRITVELI